MVEEGIIVVLTAYPLKRSHRGVTGMKVSYDKKHDIACIRSSSKKLDGTIEIDEGAVLDTTAQNEIVGIEIFDASKRFPLRNLFTLEPVGWRTR